MVAEVVNVEVFNLGFDTIKFVASTANPPSREDKLLLCLNKTRDIPVVSESDGFCIYLNLTGQHMGI
jgi:hypothetical protein